MQSNNICVIIVTYNGMKWLNRCLSDLMTSTTSVDVVVVDNQSNDGTVDFIKKHYPNIKLFEMNRNLGFGQANNYGMRHALDHNYDYVFLLNQDAYVYPDMFEKLIEGVNNADIDNIGIASPLQLHPNGEWLEEHFKAYIKHRISIDSKLAEEVICVEGVQAAGWLIPRRTLETIGGFNPIFFHYGEDENYFQRVNYHGLKTVVVTSAKMIHYHIDYGKRELESKDKIFRMLKSQSFLNINKTLWNIAYDCSVWTCRGIYHAMKYRNLSLFTSTVSAIARNIAKLKEYNSNRALAKRRDAQWLMKEILK